MLHNHLRTAVWHQRDGKTATAKRNNQEIEPKPGLAYSPKEMAELHAKGMPINSANLVNAFHDGDTNPSFDITIDRRRSVDVAEIWEASLEAKSKESKFHRVLKSNQNKS